MPLNGSWVSSPHSFGRVAGNAPCSARCDRRRSAVASRRGVLRGASGLVLASLFGGATANQSWAAQDDPLPSWNEGAVKEAILGFAEAEGGRTAILLDPALVQVVPQAKRAHQGWRYLEATDAPSDLGTGDMASLPPELAGKLAELGL